GSPAEAHRRDDGRPTAVVAAFGGGGDVHRAHDLPREEPLLAALVPGGAGLERHPQHGREHGGGEIFGILPRRHLVLAIAVVLGDVAVMRSEERRVGKEWR